MDGEGTVPLSAIDAAFVVATCVSPPVARRNVSLTRGSRVPTVVVGDIVCVSTKLRRALLAGHLMGSAANAGRPETMSVRA